MRSTPGWWIQKARKARASSARTSRPLWSPRPPLGRIGQPSDIADVAVFLASDDSRWLTGEKLSASGGLR
ncbi:MAG: SDR family oxidoreductase [Caulobacteraceae bacterium]